MHSFHSPIWQWSLVALCTAALLWSVLRFRFPDKDIQHCEAPWLIRGYVCRQAAVAQIMMLAVMAAMFAFPATPAAVWQVILIAGGVALTVQLLMSGVGVVQVCSHLLAVTAMLYATTAHGAAHHTASSPGLVFTAAFLLEAALLAGVVAAGPARLRHATAVGPHVVMDAAMVMMLNPGLGAG